MLRYNIGGSASAHSVAFSQMPKLVALSRRQTALRIESFDRRTDLGLSGTQRLNAITDAYLPEMSQSLDSS